MNQVSNTKGNAKTKRMRRGFEKNWNKFAEPLMKLLGSGCNFPINLDWLKYKRRNDKQIKDDE